MNKFDELVKYANSINIAVEKDGNKYSSWCKEDCSVIAEAANLEELASDIESLSYGRTIPSDAGLRESQRTYTAGYDYACGYYD